ncbi:MAG: 5-(carboxyamino)imidazole ribonucleotide mutase [Muribaculaceae bacterium]|nr:5-(carboxyamino)imidazole ribonucleotide mutase [Muribaculaceae bacterium]
MKVGIVMGSASDRPVMAGASEILNEFGIEHEVKILSAHRTPAALQQWVESLRQRDFAAVIAAAGGAAHLAGVVAAFTTLPVIGVPVKSRSLEGIDSLLSMVQMPSGIPVACVAIDGSKNAALLAIEIMAVTDVTLRNKLSDFRAKQAAAVLAANELQN